MRFIVAGLLLMAESGALQAAPLTITASTHCVVAAPYQDTGAADYVPAAEADAGVPPADMDPPFTIEIGQVLLPIQVDLAARRGEALASGLIEEALAGFVSVQQGVVYFNNRPLGGAHSQLLHCQ